ncbi:MAG: hypothetical protein ABI340_04755 [Nitrososphaera sp.]|jgi:hypothetical protein
MSHNIKLLTANKQNDKMKRWLKISSICGVIFVGIIIYLVGQNFSNLEAFAQSSSLTIISLSSDNKLIGSGQFVISPNPFTGNGNYTMSDNSQDDTDKDKDGVITLTGIKNGNYSILQIGTMSGYSIDRILKTVQVKSSSAVATFTNLPVSDAMSSSARSVTYSTKFECGSIYAGEGPLRPGHYDTDISMFNKQKTKMQIFWNAVVNNGSISNALLINMDSDTSKSITCKDVRSILGNNNDNFVEGFVIISVPLDSSFSPGITVSNTSTDINLLDVQAFYTANALDRLPQEVIVDKISFYIVQDSTGKIPKDVLRTTLDVSIPSTLNQIDNTQMKVKKMLANQYNLTNNDLSQITILIKDVSVGVGVLIDDHAISLSTVKPQLSS